MAAKNDTAKLQKLRLFKIVQCVVLPPTPRMIQTHAQSIILDFVAGIV